jgi:hypothetical protein
MFIESCTVVSVHGSTSVTVKPALAACYALAQLAWSNEQNSYRIPLLPNLLDSLAAIFEVRDDDASMEMAQEQAAVVVGNCAANSSQAAEVMDRKASPAVFRLILTWCCIQASLRHIVHP